MGRKTQDIFHTFAETGDTYAQAIHKLDEHFIPKRNTTYEHSIFRQAKQDSDETVDRFCTRFRKLANYCEYPNLDDEIRDQILASCSSSKLRKRLLTQDNLTLTKTLNIARAMETSERQTKDIEEGVRTKTSKNDYDSEVNFMKGKHRQFKPGNKNYNN